MTSRTRRVEVPGTLISNHIWMCHYCDADIIPKLRARVGERSEIEEAPLYHPVALRNLLETLLCVDVNYRSVEQRDVAMLRKNKAIFWNLIFFF